MKIPGKVWHTGRTSLQYAVLCLCISMLLPGCGPSGASARKLLQEPSVSVQQSGKADVQADTMEETAAYLQGEDDAAASSGVFFEEPNRYAEEFHIYRRDDGAGLLEIHGEQYFLLLPDCGLSVKPAQQPPEKSAAAVQKRGNADAQADTAGEDISGIVIETSEGKQQVPDPGHVIVLRTPVRNAYLAATASMAFLLRLQALDSFRFVSLLQKNWYLPAAAEAMRDGKLLYAGKYSAPDYEALLSGGCGLAAESTMILHKPEVREKLEALGIPVLIDYASYEPHAMGRAEWIRVYGLLTGTEERAEAFLAETEAKLAALREQAGSPAAGEQPSVAYGYFNEKGQAVIRSAGDYIPELIRLGGCRYAFSGEQWQRERAGFAISMEAFLETAGDADILILTETIRSAPASTAELCRDYPLLRSIPAVEQGRVYVTGNDFYQATDGMADFAGDIFRMRNGAEEGFRFLRKLPMEAMPAEEAPAGRDAG